ncbi:MAG: DUF2062 domain-containing protein [Nitrospirota bacterium]|jgi:uncharacterized protein (DUF2062 family)
MRLTEGWRARLGVVLSVRDTPRRIAVSFAVGLFVGFSPLIGLHTLLGIALAWAFRLNRVVLLTAVYINNPLSMIPIYTFCTWLGSLMLGVDLSLPSIEWKRVTMSTVAGQLGDLLLPFLVGSSAVAALAAIVSYVVIRRSLELRRGLRRIDTDE